MKQKKMRITLKDFILANRRASRAEEIEKYGQQVHNRRMVHKSKKKYDRKAMKRAVIKGDDSSYCLLGLQMRPTTPYGMYKSLPVLLAL